MIEIILREINFRHTSPKRFYIFIIHKCYKPNFISLVNLQYMTTIIKCLITVRCP